MWFAAKPLRIPGVTWAADRSPPSDASAGTSDSATRHPGFREVSRAFVRTTSGNRSQPATSRFRARIRDDASEERENRSGDPMLVKRSRALPGTSRTTAPSSRMSLRGSARTTIGSACRDVRFPETHPKVGERRLQRPKRTTRFLAFARRLSRLARQLSASDSRFLAGASRFLARAFSFPA